MTYACSPTARTTDVPYGGDGEGIQHSHTLSFVDRNGLTTCLFKYHNLHAIN